MFVVPLPVLQVKIGKGRIVTYHQHILRVPILRGLGEIETTRYKRSLGAARVDHHYFVVGAGMPGISENRYAFSRYFRNQARGDSSDLILVREDFNVHAPVLGCNQCFRNLAMGKTERLHQYLAMCSMNDIRDKLPCIVSRCKSSLYRAGGW